MAFLFDLKLSTRDSRTLGQHYTAYRLHYQYCDNGKIQVLRRQFWGKSRDFLLIMERCPASLDVSTIRGTISSNTCVTRINST